ncbi:ISAs1 family transposase [Sansalvadorimonas verongulae]|nr:ISAs1 family transposase [Sansalvadorimonas verongulae]
MARHHALAECKEDWLSQYLELPGGIPSHDTFNRIYSLLDPAEFRDLFTGWVKDMLIDTPLSGVVAIDGKTVRGSRDKSGSAIHMVNAWSAEAGISLGQYKVDRKSNEITAVPEFLDKLAIEGCMVTADAMSCQKRIASKVLKSKADYLLAVKNNQRKLYGELDRYFTEYWQKNPLDNPEVPQYSEKADKGHGRVEQRRAGY